MDPALQKYTLSELGIDTSTNIHGEQSLIIILPPNQLFGSGQAQAVYNPVENKWSLSISTHSKFGSDIRTQFRRRPSVKGDVSIRRQVPWTDNLPKTDHVDKFLNGIDWQATSLGTLEKWPKSLQAYLNIVFADSQAAVIYWGDDLVALYNESFTRLVSGRLSKPEEMFGVPFIKIWPELWEDFSPMLQSIKEQGCGIDALETNLFPLNHGVIEETFWQGSFLPIKDDAGRVQGFYNRAREITKYVVNERKVKVLSAIAGKPNLTGGFIYSHIIRSFSQSERDFPLAFIYSAEEDGLSGRCQLKLECGEGLLDAGHPQVPSELELYDGHAGFVPYFRKAKSQDKVLVLHRHDSTLPEHLIDGFQWNGFGEPSSSLAILPLSTSDRLLAILVLGLNPRRPYDEQCEGFLNTLLRSVSATLASAIDREEAHNRAARLAKQLADGEKSIREMAEYGPVGIARLSASGIIVWANNQLYEITGHGRNREDHYELSFIDYVYDEDKESCAKFWSMLLKTEPNSTAIRIKRKWQPPSNPDGRDKEECQNMWVLISGYPIMDKQQIKAIAISISDITRFKWAEQVEARRAVAAKEAKRLQENFIDIVSHEMRNPLSAIVQLSDAIAASVEDFEQTNMLEKDARSILGANVDNATTILLCAAHQKRIIDDVLTLSKLDSMLLSITPVAVQPYRIVEGVLRMFDAEFEANKIRMICQKAGSYTEYKVDWVYLDPSRLTQILINLITNAIKFTKTESTREIHVRVGATSTRPPSLADVRWFPTNKMYQDLTLSEEWGNGEPLFICFEVQDTGRGLQQDEMNKLFGRFQQATAKTHIKYGGSGLGLFISRELTETQGGEIGCRSEQSRGTTFAFYVKARRAEAPTTPQDPSRPSSQPVDTQLTRQAEQAEQAQQAQQVQQVQQAQQQHALQAVDSGRIEEKLTILLCEDNVVNAKILERQLQRVGCEVYLANHGMEALDILRKSSDWVGMTEEKAAMKFDVILMDVEMPIMDGLTCTRRIRQLEKEGKLHRRSAIIAITANVRQEQLDNVKEAGVDDVLPKPFRVAECLAKIKTLLG